MSASTLIWKKVSIKCNKMNKCSISAFWLMKTSLSSHRECLNGIILFDSIPWYGSFRSSGIKHSLIRGYILVNLSWTRLRLIPLLPKKHRSRLPGVETVVPQSWDLLLEHFPLFRPSILKVNSWLKIAADTPAFITGNRNARQGEVWKDPPSS